MSLFLLLGEFLRGYYVIECFFSTENNLVSDVHILINFFITHEIYQSFDGNLEVRTIF